MNFTLENLERARTRLSSLSIERTDLIRAGYIGGILRDNASDMHWQIVAINRIKACLEADGILKPKENPMKMPEPGQTADYKLQLTCAECEELIKAVDQIFTIAKDNTAHVTANLLQYNPQEHVRFVSAAFRLARFVRDEITEDLVTS